MENGFKNKVVLVTGGASGIGAATAELFARRGASVVIADLDEKAAAAKANELVSAGFIAASCVADVADSAACDGAVNQTLSLYGRLDVLVNNAGGGKLCPTIDLSDEDWRHMQAINTDSTFYMSRAAIRVMLGQGSGAIVNVASVHGKVGFNNHIGYTAAKAAIVNMTRTMGIEYSSRGIRVNAVCPGVILTPLIERSLDEDGLNYFTSIHPIGRLGRPDEVAKAICFLASDEASFIVGESLSVDGGYTAQ